MPTGVLFGQIALVFGVALAGVWAATQWTMAALGYQIRLGFPRFELRGIPIYHPWLPLSAATCSVFLTVQRIQREQPALEPQVLNRLLCRGDLTPFVPIGQRHLADHQALIGCLGGQPLQRRHIGKAIKAAAQQSCRRWRWWPLRSRGRQAPLWHFGAAPARWRVDPAPAGSRASPCGRALAAKSEAESFSDVTEQRAKRWPI